MSYLLKQFDLDLLTFDMQQDVNGVKAQIISINEKFRFLLPLGLELTDDGLAKWLKRRIAPYRRWNMANLFPRLGLNERDVKGILNISKGLSVDDCYWIINENSSDKFEDFNLYDNKFNNQVAKIALTGGGTIKESNFISSPDFTTNGMLPKCWRRVNGKIVLYKARTPEATSAGYEPYGEYYAYQIAKKMGPNAVAYNIKKWNNTLCSTCELFTSKEYSFVPINHLLKHPNIYEIIEYYKSLGEKFYEALVDMIIFDAIVINSDRHLGNFGLLVDNKTNKIYSPAPLFDHGLSLLSDTKDNMIENAIKTADVRAPSIYSDFMGLAKELIGPSQKEKLRKLINFQFKKHPRYNWSNSRLKAIEKLIQSRVRKLLE